MGALRQREDVTFFEIVSDLEWRLDDGGGEPPPGDQPEFYRGGGGGVWPKWATHVIAFLLGGITFGWLLMAPIVVAGLALATLIGLCSVAVFRRWR